MATAATMGKVAIPAMRENGYSTELSTATVAAGGTLGSLIPPSVIMVIYGIATETHIGKLFAAAIIPGIIGILGYCAAVQWTVWRNPDSGPVGPEVPASERRKLVWGVMPVVLLFMIVLGGIYSGIFTAVEAAGVGAMGSFLFAVFARKLSLSTIHAIFSDAVYTSGTMFAILIGATVFSEFINLTGVHTSVLALIDDSSLSPLAVMFLIVGIFIILGCFLESISMILLLVPIVFPVVISLGYDPVWFGIIVVVAVEIGLITPPIGINLFVIQSICPGTRLATIVRGVIPFIVSDVLRIILLVLVPILSTWLPNLLFQSF